MADSADHVSGKTGLTLTVTLSKAAGAFSSISPTVVERSGGWYAISLTTAHTDTLGDLVLRATGTGADAAGVIMQVVSYNPTTGSVRLASDGLDAVVVETGVNARQALSPILAAAAGALSGAGTGTITIKGGNVATTRIVASTDSSGNRTAVTLNIPT